MPTASVEAQQDDVLASFSDGKYTLEIYTPGTEGPLIERIRRKYRSAVEGMGYEGFSADFDRKYDPVSTYCVVRNGKRIAATSRIVRRAQNRKLPFEEARIPGTELSLSASEGTSELTTFWFSSHRSLKVVCKGLLTCLLEGDESNCVYVTYDRTVDTIRSIYVNFLNLSEPRPNLTLCHDGYDRDGETVRWGLLTISRDGLFEIKKEGLIDPYT